MGDCTVISTNFARGRFLAWLCSRPPFPAPAAEAQARYPMPGLVRISVASALLLLWWLSRSAWGGPFSERIAVCSEKGASYIRPSLLLLGFPPHPEAGFFRVLRGADSMIEQFVCKGTIDARVSTARAPAALFTDKTDTRHG